MAATSLPAPSVFSPHTLLEVESSLSPLPENILTAPAFCRTLKSPKVGRLAEAFASVPALVKIAAFSVSATSAPRGRGFILAEQRPVSVRTGGLSTAGERCSAFLFSNIQIPEL